MNEEKLTEISNRLEILIKLTAIGLTRGRDEKEKAWLLSQADLTPKEIAKILRKTPNSVRIMLFKIRREGLHVTVEGDEDG